jgi:hypothetical protein
MVASLVRQQVVVGEQRILHEFVLEVIGLARPARGTTGPGSSAGLAGQRVAEQLLVLAPPVLTEQWLTHGLAPAAPGHHGPARAGRAPDTRAVLPPCHASSASSLIHLI